MQTKEEWDGWRKVVKPGGEVYVWEGRGLCLCVCETE